MEITFLGTSAMQPTKERNPSAVLLQYNGQGILFDCAEGTQRQLKIAGLPITSVTKVLISHWHGDHVLGLSGLIQSLGASDYKGVVELYGPIGSKKYVKSMFEGIEFDFRVNFKVIEVEDGVIFENDDYRIECAPLKHKIPCLGYSFIEKDRLRIKVDACRKFGIPEGPLMGKLQQGKDVVVKGKTISAKDVTYTVEGKKVTYLVDTGLTHNCYELAEDADLLICEASFAKELSSKAEEYLHLTSHDAGLIASKSGAKKLVLTHFSARYTNTAQLESDARDVFDNVVCAKDFMRIKL